MYYESFQPEDGSSSIRKLAFCMLIKEKNEELSYHATPTSRRFPHPNTIRRCKVDLVGVEPQIFDLRLILKKILAIVFWIKMP